MTIEQDQPAPTEKTTTDTLINNGRPFEPDELQLMVELFEIFYRWDDEDP